MGGRIPRVARVWAAVLGVALGVSVLLPAAPAAAHNALTGSDPRDGARVAAAPERIELRFLAKPDPDTTKITVTGPDDIAALGGEPRYSGNRVSVPFAPGKAGRYVVGYQLVSGDGHPITGEIRFTLTTGTPADPTATTEPTATPEASATATAEAEPTPTESPAPEQATPMPMAESTGTGWWWAGIAAVVLLAVLATARLLRRRAARR